MAGMMSMFTVTLLFAVLLSAGAQNPAAEARPNMAASARLVTSGDGESTSLSPSSSSSVGQHQEPGGDSVSSGTLRAALDWLKSRRNPRDGGWGNHTALAVLAMQLAQDAESDAGTSSDVATPNATTPAGTGSRRGRWASPSNPVGLLAVKQMELELVLHLWRWKNALLRVESAANSRHHEAPITTGKLSQYTLALNAVCKDPKKFHGHDLINMLQHHEAELDYEFAVSSLAVCSSGAHVRKRQIRRLLEIAERVNDHNVDTLSMVLLALKCIVHDHRNRNLDQYIRKPTSGLAQQQQTDGSFVGSLHSTALAMQALEAGDNENESLGGSWNRSAALHFLQSRQGADGSFIDIATTAEVILALGPRSLGAVRDSGCPSPPAVKFLQSLPPALAPKMHHHHHHKHVTSTGNNSAKGISSNSSKSLNIGINTNSGSSEIPNENGSTSTTSVTTPVASTTTIGGSANNNLNNSSNVNVTTTINLTSLESLAGFGKKPELVKVTYSIWVHSNVSENYNLTVQAEHNTTFYNVMLLAAQEDLHYQFEATEWPNGHYVHTLAGFKEEPTSYYFWLLYQTPEMPDPANPPGNQLITPVGVDGLLIEDGNHYLFWYKKL